MQRPVINNREYLSVVANAEKIQKELNWFPIESFETGIKKTVEWYLKNESWWRVIQNKTYKQERLGENI